MHDVLDVREIAEEWRDALEDDECADTAKYVALCAELGITASADALEEYEDPTLIAESYFQEYAQELAEDIGAIDHNATWPMNCIDWEQAARDLRYDYTSVTFDGDEYLVRS